MKCPHCRVEFHADQEIINLGIDVEGHWGIRKFKCPNPKCKKDIHYLIQGKLIADRQGIWSVRSDGIKQVRLIKSCHNNIITPDILSLQCSLINSIQEK